MGESMSPIEHGGGSSQPPRKKPKARTIRGKESRSKLSLLHVAGSKSYARIGHELAGELGYNSRRDEVFIKTHTRKSGVPTAQAGPLIKKLQEAAMNHPELKERPIQEGDLYAHVFGEKEPRGCVRVLGLGPTPQNVGTPGANAKVPIKLAMEIELRRQAEQQVSTLLARMDQLQQQIGDMQQLLHASQGGQNVESPSPHGSNSRPVISRVQVEAADEEQHDHHIVVEPVLVQNGSNNEDEDMIIHKRVAAKKVPQRSLAATPRNLEASYGEEESLVGRDVMLYHLVRSEPVAKATILSTDPNTTVGGEPLGRQYYEVVVNVVLKRDVELPCAYDEMETVGDAFMMSIGWPSNRMNPCSKSRMPSS